MNTLEENQLLDEYINGTLDLELCTKLEGNAGFMKLVFIKTRDTNYYKFCAKSLKNNYDFLMFLIKLFNSDQDFIYEIITHYLFYDVNHDDKYIEVLTLAEKLFRCNVNDGNYVYFMRCKSRIIDFMQAYEKHADSMIEYEDGIKDKNTIGFFVAMNEYKNNPQVLDFIASNYMYKIFTSYNFDEYIHFKYKTKEELLLCNQNDLIIDFISKIDSKLAEYVKDKEELLFNGLNKLNRAIYKFDSYEDVDSQSLVDKFNCSLNNFLCLNSIEYTYKIDMVKIEEVKKLGLEEEFYSDSPNIVEFLKASDDDPIIYVTRKFIRKELEKIFKIKILKKVR